MARSILAAVQRIKAEVAQWLTPEAIRELARQRHRDERGQPQRDRHDDRAPAQEEAEGPEHVGSMVARRDCGR